MENRPGRGARGFARVGSRPLGGLFRTVFAGEIRGRNHLPEQAPFIVTANHLSLVDPVLVTLAVGRLIRFLALDELYGLYPLLDRSMVYFGAIPISRERAPLGALRQGLEVLADDDVLGIFPEGARAEYWGERTIKRGAAWLSMATGAPIVPCSIVGSEGTLSLIEPGVHAPAVKLAIHPPLYPGTYIDYEDPLGAMMDDWATAIDSDARHWKREEQLQ